MDVIRHALASTSGSSNANATMVWTHLLPTKGPLGKAILSSTSLSLHWFSSYEDRRTGNELTQHDILLQAWNPKRLINLQVIPATLAGRLADFDP